MKKTGSVSGTLLVVATAALIHIGSSNITGSVALSNADLIGLWFGELRTPMEVQGDLTIDNSGSHLRAITSAFNVPVIASPDQSYTFFEFPAAAGRFRLASRVLSLDKTVGFVIQRGNEINGNNYATPVELSRVGKMKWKGRLEPFEPRLSFNLSIQQAADGSLTAIIRNPEANLFRRDIYHIELHNTTLSFSDAKSSKSLFDGQFDAQDRTITLRLPNFDKTIKFRRTRSNEPTGFVPRVPRDQKYVYQKPKDAGDGWMTASVSDVGLDAKLVGELIDKILHADPTNNSLNIHSLLVARHGKLVLEEYFYGFERAQPHDMRSASKTFAPLLVGIAREHGAKLDINTPVYTQFPEYKGFANWDSRKSNITVRDLMTMTSGLSCDDNDDDSPGNEDVMQQQSEQPDWYKYTLDLPMARDPGGNQAVYCSAGFNLLGGIVSNATRTWLPEFFYEQVAKPLQIRTFHWNLTPNGDGYAGGGLYLRPRDQLKLGQLYLNGGVWNGKHIVSKEWLQKSTSKQSSFGQTLGVDHDYGYGWHLYHFDINGRSYPAYAAGGNGGQIVMVVPDLDLIVGFTGGAYGEFPKWYKWQTELVSQFILPAAISTSVR
jgi:CubicO group peptidase (beta-lactamase class C family)